MDPIRITKAQLERYQVYARVFDTDDGKKVLEDLESDYKGGCFVKGDLYMTLYKSALRDFVDYIKDKVERAKGPFDVEEEE